ncbi:PaaI family thioesterase [Aquidulcibacter paucihalophilus]|uniref:PaaI family thioesterase n=1 Tax=Aquidulcibacter paucihalophilus TaxID=1978549 RepID=UPI000A1917D6|nr:PaaI family thioesterase [Aquidulcibacter paucihalophilus]
MSPDEINQFLAQAFSGGTPPLVKAADGETARCRIAFNPNQIRPGGTLSGPTMMALADTAAYALVLSAIGFEPLAVTTNLSIQFMRKPKPKDLIAEVRMMKLGKTLAVMEAGIRSDGETDLVAHAVITYAIPPKKVPA